MKTTDFFFDLPDALIAQEPPAVRGTSRLMAVNRSTGTWQHLSVGDLPNLVEPGTVLVFNDSRVRKARVYAVSEETGATVEFLFLAQTTDGRWRTLTSKQKKQKPGKSYLFPGDIRGWIAAWEGDERIVEMATPLDEAFFENYGHVPLPPYIKRKDSAADNERYQTIYSRETGSAAAPTAGLHFTQALLKQLQDKGCQIAYVTLHVGLGTFLPIRTENIEEHTMHEESYAISNEAARLINTGLDNHKPILAVGTTAVRTLESACVQGRVVPGSGKTGIYIFPGYQFKVVSHLFTNFHTPGSTLLLLISALAGKGLIDKVYQEAIAQKYRFFSYGDAMFIHT